MPSSITHAYIAKDIYERLNSKVKKKITRNYLNDYKTYSQGMDVLYFKHIFFPITKKGIKVRKFASYTHNYKTNEFLISLANMAKESKNVYEFLFLIGLSTHYIADSTIHPYINYLATKKAKGHLTKRDCHFIIETYIDNYLVYKREKCDYRDYKAYQFCFNVLNKERNDVKELLNKVCKDVFDEDNIGNSYFESLDTMRKFFKVMRYDKYRIKRYIYNVLNVVTRLVFRDIRYLSYNFDLNNDKEFLNLSHHSWYNIDNKSLKSKESFLDLYEEVIKEATTLIEKLYLYVYEDKKLDLEKLFGNKSYSNGLPLE